MIETDANDNLVTVDCEQTKATNGKNLIVNEISKTTKNTISVAKRRWKILAKALCNRTPKDNEKCLNRFVSFELLTQVACASEENLFVYTFTIDEIDFSVKVRHVKPSFTPDDLIGFNNTGNICVWPSEEALAHYALVHLPLFRGKRILELGGGMTCLASMLIAKYASADFVHLTDGNFVSVENVRASLQRNEFYDGGQRVRASVLRWESAEARHDELYDYIISADCLFFDNARSSLVNAIWQCLRDDGCAIVVAPRRGQTLNQFVRHAEDKGFHCIVVENYDNCVWQRHLRFKQMNVYDENVHYPLLIRLTKFIPLLTR